MPQTVYFKRFGTFDNVFGVEGGAADRPRPARGTDVRTYGETGAGAQTTPATHPGKKYDVRRPPPHSNLFWEIK